MFFFRKTSDVVLVYMNLPLCFVALVVLVTSLHRVELKTASNASWLTLSRKFDFVGL